MADAASPDRIRRIEKFSARLARAFAKRGLVGGCLLGTAAMVEACEMLKCPHELVRGFLIIDGTMATRHVWVTVAGKVFDPASDATGLVAPAMRDAQFSYASELPLGAERIDQDNLRQLADLELGIDCLFESVATFWSKAPGTPRERDSRRRLVASQLSRIHG